MVNSSTVGRCEANGIEISLFYKPFVTFLDMLGYDYRKTIMIVAGKKIQVL